MATTVSISDIEIRKCSNCGSDKTNLKHTKIKTPYPSWYKDDKGGWLCQKCFLKFWKIKKHYNLTYNEYILLLQQSNYKCEICGNKPKRGLDTDHDHHTGKIRGLLCWSCNMALGYFKDDPNTLQKALEYLMK